jgi:phenylalanyl-tRNA synthetase alpha chain
MLERLNKLKLQAEKEISELASLADLESLRVRYFGKKSELTEILKSLGALSTEERKLVGMEANNIKNLLAEKLADMSRILSEKDVKHTISRVADFDTSLPGTIYSTGSFNPVTIVQREIEKIFTGMGFSIVDGPEVEDEYYNFEALNIPKFHPERDMQDTYWLENGSFKGLTPHRAR